MSDFTGSADPAPEQPRSFGLVSSASAPAAGQVSAAWQDSSADEDASQERAEEATPEATVASVELSDIEARVLGSLVEKSFLTPDSYPMTTNAMVSACNQKTNREPVVSYSAVMVDSALLDMRQRNLVRRVHSAGARSTKHRQTLDEALALNDRQLALMSVLLLRGAQTIGELRLRTERHAVGFDDLDAVETCLVGLAGRSTPLVKQLQRQPGHKEARWEHLLGDPEAGPHAESADHAQHRDEPVSPTPATTSAAPLESDLQQRVAELETEVASLRRQLSRLAEQLGEPLD